MDHQNTSYHTSVTIQGVTSVYLLKKNNSPNSPYGHGILLHMPRCLSSVCRLMTPHTDPPIEHSTFANPQLLSCASRSPSRITSRQPSSSNSKNSSFTHTTPWQQWINRSFICSFTARFTTSCPESQVWLSMGHLSPLLMSDSIQLVQKVCPHLMEMTGSRNTLLHTGQSRAVGSSTNFVGLAEPGPDMMGLYQELAGLWTVRKELPNSLQLWWTTPSWLQ